LRAELQVPPSRETRLLLEAIHAHAGARRAGVEGLPPPLPPVLERQERSRLLGREDPLGWLHGQWSEARGGSGRLAVIAGDPGIGKTRLVTELGRAAHAAGAAVLVGHCQEEVLISY